MATLQVYETLVEKPVTKSVKPETVKELPDDANLVMINGLLVLVDGYNDSTFSVDDIVKTLDKLSDKLMLNDLEKQVVTAVHNFFDQLKEEYK